MSTISTPNVVVARSNRPRLLVLTAFLASLFLLPRLLLLAPKSGDILQSASRHSMRDFAVTRLDGGPWRLSDHRGQVVLINFWATWCGPCQEEMPALSAVALNNPPASVSVVGVSVDTLSRDRIADFAARNHIGFPVLLPDRSWQLDEAVSGIPTTLLIDRSGRVAKTYTGPVRRKDLQADIDELLREHSS